MNTFSIFRNALHIGPNYHNHKGGMGAVIDMYQRKIFNFNFISSYEGNYGTVANVPYFLFALLKITWVLYTDKKIKILHIHSAAHGSFYRKYLVFLLGSFVFKKKVIFHLHAGNFETFFNRSGIFTKKSIAYLINNSECVIVLSEIWMEFIKSHFKPKNLIILNNPIELPIINQDSNFVDSKLTHFLFLGRIVESKGIFDLINVLYENRVYYRNKLKLSVGGDGEFEKLKYFIISNQMQDMIEYIGWVDGCKKKNSLSSCNTLILPSYFEGSPISILEAMSYGKAIIATNVGGIPEIVQDGVNGFLIRPGDTLALKEKIDFMISNKECSLSMGHKSREIIYKYDVLEVIKQMESLYQEML